MTEKVITSSFVDGYEAGIMDSIDSMEHSFKTIGMAVPKDLITTMRNRAKESVAHFRRVIDEIHKD